MVEAIVGAVIGGIFAVIAALVPVYLDRRRKQGPGEGPVPGLGRRIRQHPGRLIAAASVGAILGLALVLVYRPFFTWWRIEQQDELYEDLISASLRDRKPYAMPALVMNVDLDSVAGPPLQLSADIRTTYLVHAVDPLRSDTNTFEEGYHTDVEDARVFRLPATDRAEPASHGNTAQGRPTNVFFDLGEGRQRLLVTGARYVFPPGKSPASNMFPAEGEREGEFCYPNSALDVIHNLMIYVESRTLALRLNPVGRLSAGSAPIPGAGTKPKPNEAIAEVYRDPEHANIVPHTLVVAQWDSLPPGWQACLKVWW